MAATTKPLPSLLSKIPEKTNNMKKRLHCCRRFFIGDQRAIGPTYAFAQAYSSGQGAIVTRR